MSQEMATAAVIGTIASPMNPAPALYELLLSANKLTYAQCLRCAN
jgi:hypothetical protein